jgi:hypothetical protein
VHELGERLDKPVGECLYHDGVVVVVVLLEAKRRPISPETGCDGEEPYLVFETRVPWGDEVGEGAVRTARRLLSLLAQEVGLASTSSRDSSV